MQTKAVLKHTSGNHLSTTAYDVVRLLHGPRFTCLSVPAKGLCRISILRMQTIKHGSAYSNKVSILGTLCQRNLLIHQCLPSRNILARMISLYISQEPSVCHMVLLSKQTNLQLFDLCSGTVLSNFILFSWFLKTFYYSYLFCAHAYMCMHRCNACICSYAHVCMPWASMCRSELVLSFYHLTPGGPTQIIKISG